MARESLLGTAVLTGFKAAVFFPFFYHTFLGFRHWSWDIFAVGIRDMATFYNTGYIAIAASLVLTGTLFQNHWVRPMHRKLDNIFGKRKILKQ